MTSLSRGGSHRQKDQESRHFMEVLPLACAVICDVRFALGCFPTDPVFLQKMLLEIAESWRSNASS